MNSKSKETDILLKQEPQLVSDLVERMGCGRFQYILAVVECLIALMFAIQCTMIGILIYIIDNNWSLTDTEISMFGGSMLASMGLGFLCSSLFENYLGRWGLLKLALIIVIVFSVVSAMMQEIVGLIIARCFVIFGTFLLLAPSYSSISEMIPSSIRGKFLTLCDLCGIFGNFLLLAFVYLFIPDLEGETWRPLVSVYGVVPALPCLIICFLLVDDSPIYFSKRKMPNQCIKSLNRIAYINNQPPLTAEEMALVYRKNSIMRGIVSLSMFFNRENFRTTVLLVVLWNANVAGYNGMLSIFPYMIEDDENDGILYTLLLFSIAQIPGMMLLIYMMGHTNIGRRVTVLILSGLSLLFTTLPIIIHHDVVVIVCLSIFIALKYDLVMALYVYTIELYTTELRNSSIAYINTQSRFVVILFPYVLILLIDYSNLYAFLLLAVIEGVSILMILMIPHETQGAALDSSEKD